MIPCVVLADVQNPTWWELFAQHCIFGLATGSLFALIALGYTMVYGIIGLINFAHGEVFMMGAFLALSLLFGMGFVSSNVLPSTAAAAGAIFTAIVVTSLFCGALNLSIDYAVYRPLRTAPKLAPLVSAIGVSFILQNLGLFWKGAADTDFPKLFSDDNLLAFSFPNLAIQISRKDVLVIAITVPIMIALHLFVSYTKLGRAMRAVEQNPLAARLMGINVDRVIAVTFFLGGALGGAAAVVYGLYINTVSFQMGFQNGLYAFTAAVVGGIGNIPGAVVGGLIIGLTRSLGAAYLGEKWTGALIFSLLIVILVFRPAGVLGRATPEKV